MYHAWKMGAFLELNRDSKRDGLNAAWVWSARNKAEIRDYQYGWSEEVGVCHVG